MAEGFFGGLSGGISDAQTQLLAQRKQEAEQEVRNRALAASQLSDTLKHIQEVAKASAASGNDPKKLQDAVQPLILSGIGLAQAAGVDPSIFTQRAQLALMRPAVESEKKHSVVKIGVGPHGEDRYGVLEQTSGTVTPIGAASSVIPASGQPKLTQSDIITPGQAATANALPTPGPVAQPGPSGMPAMPIQRVAMGFPPSDQAGAAPQTPKMPLDMAPSPEAEDFAIKNNITGPEFLKALPPKEATSLGAVTQYKIDPSKLSKRIPKGQGESEYTKTLRRAQQADPNYDPKWYPVMQKTLTEFTTGGTTSPASKIVNGNTAIQHLGEIADATDRMAQVPGLLDKIAKSDMSIASYAANRLKNETVRGTSEGQALAAYLTARNRYSEEITQFYAGNVGAERDRERTINSLDAAKSLPEIYSALNTEGHLLNSKVNTLQDRWKTGMAGPRGLGDMMIRNAIPDFPILSDQSKQSLDRISQGLLRTHGASRGATSAGPVVDFKTYFGGQ